MSTEDLIAYYVALLIAQYANLPLAQAVIALFCGEAISDQIIESVNDGFNFAVTPIGQQPDSAVGVQLDAVASYRGVARVIYGLAPNTFFQFSDAPSGQTPGANGFIDALVGPVPITWIFLVAEDTKQPLYSLTDDQLYRLTQFRAQAQSMYEGLGAIDILLEQFFGNNVALLDNENMTQLYVDLNTDTDPLFGICAITQSLPRPSGVLSQAIRADLITDFFGLQDAETGYDSSFSGFSDAETALTTGTFISAP